MKKYNLLATLLLTFLAVCCGKVNPASDAPATMSGKWAFSQLKTSAGWADATVREYFEFDGQGNYELFSYTGNQKVKCIGGVVDAEEALFKSTGKVYTCMVSSEGYKFSSVGPTPFVLVNSSPACLEFTSRKLEKIEAFKPQEEQPHDTDPDLVEGTAIEAGNNIVGCIKDQNTGKGIPGVAVSDGYSLEVTDENGVYQFKATQDYVSNPRRVTRYVYFTVPAGYEVPTDNGIPAFYKNILSVPAQGLIRNDWTLVPLAKPETDWTLVAIGDPQCGTSSEVNRYINETVADMKEYVGNYPNPYAVVLGDIVHDSNNVWPLIKKSMSGVTINGKAMPFFQVMGNHDHNALVDNAYDAAQPFVDTFGPIDYSFDRGLAHVVCFDNIIVKNREQNSGKPNGMTWHEYDLGMTEDQIEWFKKDISSVEDKGNKLLILCIHAPFYSVTKHATDIKNYAKQFKNIHIVSGHTHFGRNHIHTFAGKSGVPAYENVTSTACGAWWEFGSTVDVIANPAGYHVLEISGNVVDKWLPKGTRKDAAHQLRVYDGNQTYTGGKGYLCNWYRTDNKGGAANIVGTGYASFKDCFVVEVFDDDSKYVKVELYQNGSKVGDFSHLGTGKSTNVCAFSYFFNERNKNSTTWNSTAGSYWYYKPQGTLPSEMKNWEVRVTRTFPSSGKEVVYTCNTLTTDYEDFKKK